MGKLNNNRNNQLAMIHIAKTELGLDEDTYRDIVRLVSNGRESSAGKLDYAERDRLLDHFKGRGWKNKTHSKPKVDANRTAIMDKIGALLADMKLTWTYADAIAKRMFNKPKLEWCDHKQLTGVVAALVKRQEKEEHEHSS